MGKKTVLVIVFATIMALIPQLAISSAAGAVGKCPAIGDLRYDALRVLLPQLVASGKVTQNQAVAIGCDPSTWSASQTVSSEATLVSPTIAEPLVATAAATCSGGGSVKSSANYHYDVGSPIVAYMDFKLTWCYNGKYVSNWGGYCNGGTTALGTATGWSWDGCVNYDYIPYSLGGYYPGGIHQRTQGKFGMNFVKFPNKTSPVTSIWGHYNGTCDHQFDSGTIYKYC